ncbi:MAG: helix-turn-helix domain-containing protein [Clostridia bacterium]|nr:helix-turn-helix domain-containing protein [Clostridia bacterium]
MAQWRETAFELFFSEHLKIIQIADIVGVSRQTVSSYLKECADFEKEVEWRKRQHADTRRYKKMIFMRDSRTEAAVLRREHEQAVRELSAERYH